MGECKAFAENIRMGGIHSKETMQHRLVDHNLLIAGKAQNDPGLQLVDLLAHPCFKRALARHAGTELPGGFAGRIAEAIAPKIRKSTGGKVAGYGIKWLP